MPQQQDEMNNILQRLLGVSPGAALDQPVPNIPKSVEPQIQRPKPQPKQQSFAGVTPPRELMAKIQQRDADMTARLFAKNPPGVFATPGLNAFPTTWLSPQVRAAFPNEMGPAWDMTTLSPEEFQYLIQVTPDAQQKVIGFLDRGRISPQVLDRLLAPAQSLPARGSGKKAKPVQPAKRSR